MVLVRAIRVVVFVVEPFVLPLFYVALQRRIREILA